MAHVRNVSGVDLFVPELNFRTVQADEVVQVPDARLEGFTCQPGTWVEETPAASARKAKTAAKTTSEES